jgi:uncharacterized protein
MNSAEEIESMVGAHSFCVIGASRDTSKFGYAVYRSLKSDGKKTYPVNPNAEFIDRSVCYPSVRDLPETVDVAVFVVPPPSVGSIVRECHAAGIKNIWMQPGAESTDAIDYCEANGLRVVAGECIMTRLRPEVDDDL